MEALVVERLGTRHPQDLVVVVVLGILLIHLRHKEVMAVRHIQTI
jgi:hypothetical protein